MHKITLVEPKAPGKHVYSTVNMPRLGLPLLGARLKELGYEVEIFFGSNQDIRVSDLTNSDLLGISTTTSTSQEAYRLGRYARNLGIPVVFGGPHATFLPEEALEYGDYVCRGEADSSFEQLVACLDRGEEPVEVPGVSFRRNGEIVHNPLPERADVNRSPMPDLSLFRNTKPISTYPVMTSRGCPFDCTFCSVTPMFGRKYRCRDNELVLEELRRYSGKSVFFCDDNFTADPGRTKELLKAMISGGVNLRWWGAQVRTDAARDEELLDLMKKAGCGMAYVGLESINPQTLKAFNKHQDLRDIEACIENFHRHGIMVHGMFVFGGDNDTPQTIRETVDFALRTRIDTLQFMVLTPLPGTRTYQQMVDEGRLLTRDWRFYDGHHVVYLPRLMTPGELQSETVRAFKKFYSARHLLQNVQLTGKWSAAYRAVGYWLVRKWEQENRWYYRFLDGLSGGQSHHPGVSLHKNIKKHIDMAISETDGTFRVELKGDLDQLALDQVFKTFRRKLSGNYREMILSMDKVNFASEEVIRNFLYTLNEYAVKLKDVKVSIPLDRGVLQDLMRKYDFSVPYFEFQT